MLLLYEEPPAPPRRVHEQPLAPPWKSPRTYIALLYVQPLAPPRRVFALTSRFSKSHVLQPAHPRLFSSASQTAPDTFPTAGITAIAIATRRRRR